jgi:sodium-dependent phosphate cotransporter
MAEENPKIEAVEATTLEVEDKPAGSAEARSRKDRVTGSTHFGDVDFNEEQVEEIGDATWGEVCRTCFVHDAQGWARIAGHMFLVCFALYFFLFGLDLLGSGANVLTTCTTGNFLSADLNPIAGLMIGIIMTVLLQSSSTTTSIVVALVGAGSINVKNGIYLIMGANIGTSVTNTIVSMGFLGNGDDLERAFAGATVHDMFNFLTVAILLPVEAITGYLYYLTKALLPGDMADKSDKWEGPLKKIVSPLTKKSHHS